jgi:coenzyme Q-binding protein COQ10
MHIYETTHPVAHSAEDMFALVARVEDYPKFLPLCEALEVKRRELRDGLEVIVATMTVGYGLINESFTTKVHLDRAARTILVEYLDGPFTFLENRWHFLPTVGGSCDVAFYIAYAFRSRLL